MALPSKAREIVANVLNYFKEEETTRNAFIARTSEATGVSESTVYRIQKEGRSRPEPACTSKRKDYKQVDDFDRVAIRNKIIEFYTVRRQLPTLRNLLDSLKEDLDYTGSMSHLRKVILGMGFRWKKTKTNRTILMERDSVVQLRFQYYRRKKALEDAGYNFVYLDETWIDSSYTSPYCWQGPGTDGVKAPISKGQRLIIVHAGSDRGFVPGALLIYKASTVTGDYHHEMNGTNFLKWIKERLLPNLTEKSAIVMDNASYHCVQSQKCPNSCSKKADIQKWLEEHKIAYDETMLRAELLSLAKMHKKEPTYVLDTLIREHGHEVLRLPPYHPDLNPIELIWSQLKRMVASRNTTHRLGDIMDITRAAFNEIGPERWESACRHARQSEEEHKKKDMVVDSVVDQFIIDLGAESDETTDTASQGEI